MDVCFEGSVGGPLRVDEGGRAGVDVGVLALRFVRDAGLGSCWAEVEVLLSLASAWGEAPLENEEGGDLVVILVFGFAGVGLMDFEEGLVATEEGPDLEVGGEVAGWGGTLGVSTGSGSRGF